MRRLIHLIGILSIAYSVVACTHLAAQKNKTGFTHVPVMHWFDYKVSQWSVDLQSTPPPDGHGGNCVPVAQELQKRIVKSGRMAIVVAVDPPTGPKHAMVMYSHEKGGNFSRLIDNGALTAHYPKRKEGLYEGKFGKYLGVCNRWRGSICLLDEPF